MGEDVGTPVAQILVARARAHDGRDVRLVRGLLVEALLAQAMLRCLAHLAGVGEVALEHGGAHVAEVLVGERSEHLEAVGLVVEGEEARDLVGVGEGVLEGVSGGGPPLGELGGVRLEGAHARAAQLIGGGLALAGAGGLLARHGVRGRGVVGRRGHVDVVPLAQLGQGLGGLGELERGLVDAPRVHVDGGHEAVRRRVHAQGGKAQLQRHVAALVGEHGGSRAPGGHVEYLDRDRGATDGLVVSHDLDLERLRDGIGVGDVEQTRAAHAARVLLGHGVVAVVGEHARLLHERAAAGVGEPAAVKLLLGLAGAEVVPVVAREGLDPGVVVVAVGPPRRVDLARRDADRAQRRHEEGRLLAAAAVARAQHRERVERAVVGGLVGGHLAAPVVHLAHGLVGGEPGHALPEQSPEGGAAVEHGLAVDARAHHVVHEHALAQLARPRHVAAKHERVAHERQQHPGRHVEAVGDGQRAVEVAKQRRLVLVAGCGDGGVGPVDDGAEQLAARLVAVARVVGELGREHGFPSWSRVGARPCSRAPGHAGLGVFDSSDGRSLDGRLLDASGDASGP